MNTHTRNSASHCLNSLHIITHLILAIVGDGQGGHALLPGIFSTQGSSPHLMYLLICWQILYPLSHLENPSVQFSRSVVFDSL